MTCPGGKRPSKPQKWSKILKKFHTILSKVQAVFPRQLNVCFYSVNKIVKQEIKMTKIWVKVPKFLKFCISNVNQNQKNP